MGADAVVRPLFVSFIRNTCLSSSCSPFFEFSHVQHSIRLFAQSLRQAQDNIAIVINKFKFKSHKKCPSPRHQRSFRLYEAFVVVAAFVVVVGFAVLVGVVLASFAVVVGTAVVGNFLRWPMHRVPSAGIFAFQSK